MPRRRKCVSRAPSKEVWRQKENSINPSITEKIMEKFYSGETIPIIDKETFLKQKFGNNGSVTPKPVKEPAASKTPKGKAINNKEALDIKPLPEPKFSIITPKSYPEMPCKPLHYIRFIEPSKDDIDSRVDYDMDDEDSSWLKMENEKRQKNGAPPVSTKDFEILMDRFEKESHFEIETNEDSPLNIQDDEAICCICMDGESQPYNEILFCEMCNLAVHQECYGIPYIPQGQWLCRRCFNSPSAAVNCILCPSNTGALKMTEGGFWSHILCAIWVPEVQFANPVFLEPVECVGKIPSSRWNLTCQLCKIKGVGACIQCTQKKCNFSFHPTCAQQAGFHMKLMGRPGEPKTKSNHTVYCKMHSPKIEKSKSDKFEVFRQKMLESVSKPITFRPVVPPEKIQGIGDRVHFKNKNIFVIKMLSYWALKRKYRFGVPLLRSNVYELKKNQICRLPQEDKVEEDNAGINYKACLRVRQDMEKARLLLELLRKREKLKRELMKAQEELVEKRIMPHIPYLRKLLQTLSSFDEENIFANPVNEEEVPNYRDIIKCPMDFATMYKKVNNREYIGLEDFVKDYNTMIDNCLRYNKKNSFYYQAAVEMRNKTKEVLKNAKRDIELVYSTADEIIHSIKQEPDDTSYSGSSCEPDDEVGTPESSRSKNNRRKKGDSSSCTIQKTKPKRVSKRRKLELSESSEENDTCVKTDNTKEELSDTQYENEAVSSKKTKSGVNNRKKYSL